MTLADNHKEIAEGLVRAGLLGDGCWHDVIEDVYKNSHRPVYFCVTCGWENSYGLGAHLNPSLDPDHPDFDKNANEVMRRWKGTDSFRLYILETKIWLEEVDILTTPEKFIMMIWDEVKR